MNSSNDTQQPDEQPAADASAPEGEDSKRLEFSDRVRIDADTDELWAHLSDPQTLTECVPGAQSIERVSERKYTLDIQRGVSHLTVSLSGEAEFVEMNPPESVVTVANAFDQKTGSDFDILAAMEIQQDDDGASVLAYTAEVTFSGGVASISTTILKPIINRDINTYFENVKAKVES